MSVEPDLDALKVETVKDSLLGSASEFLDLPEQTVDVFASPGYPLKCSVEWMDHDQLIVPDASIEAIDRRRDLNRSWQLPVDIGEKSPPWIP